MTREARDRAAAAASVAPVQVPAVLEPEPGTTVRLRTERGRVKHKLQTLRTGRSGTPAGRHLHS